MSKKLFIGLFVLLLGAGNSGLSQLGRFTMSLLSSWDNRYTNSFSKSWPLTDAEEKSDKGEEASNESIEDDEYISIKWASFRLSDNSDQSENDAKDLFKSIDQEISVPPPRA